MQNRLETFKEKLYECHIHKKRLLSAKNKLKFIMPLDMKKYNELDEIFISIIDQMLYRFSKLQDTMGEKVFPAILLLNGEEIKKMSFIDRLNRLEELELVNKNLWMELRKERNEISHEYSFNQEEVVEAINAIYDKIDIIIEVFDHIYLYSKNKFNLYDLNF